MVIFLNYRREDSCAITQRIGDRLRVEFGGANVYRDIDSIPLGADFAAHVGQAVRSCDLLLAVIGKHWATKRLFDDEDLVRKEIEVALECGIPVVPVLVDGAGLPSRTDLPESLHPVLGRQGIAVHSGNSFADDVERLIKSLRRAFGQTGVEPIVEVYPRTLARWNPWDLVRLLAGLWASAAIGFVVGVVVVAPIGMTSLARGKVGLVGAAVGALVFLGIRRFRRGSHRR